MDCSLPSSSVHGIPQARIQEWVAISSSRGSPQSRGWTCVSCLGRQIPYHWVTWKALSYIVGHPFLDFFPVDYFLQVKWRENKAPRSYQLHSMAAWEVAGAQYEGPGDTLPSQLLNWPLYVPGWALLIIHICTFKSLIGQGDLISSFDRRGNWGPAEWWLLCNRALALSSLFSWLRRARGRLSLRTQAEAKRVLSSPQLSGLWSESSKQREYKFCSVNNIWFCFGDFSSLELPQTLFFPHACPVRVGRACWIPPSGGGVLCVSKGWAGPCLAKQASKSPVSWALWWFYQSAGTPRFQGILTDSCQEAREAGLLVPTTHHLWEQLP